jgi:hypothetical protein
VGTDNLSPADKQRHCPWVTFGSDARLLTSGQGGDSEPEIGKQFSSLISNTYTSTMLEVLCESAAPSNLDWQVGFNLL